MAEHGTRQCYADRVNFPPTGCRCAKCRLAQSKYRSGLKARNAGANVTELPRRGRPPVGAPGAVPVSLPGEGRSSGGGVVGPAEAAVLEELETLTSAETRKGAAQAALAMARILDLPEALTQQPAAASRLTVILEDLRKGSARRKGRLASVQAMPKRAGPGSATGS